MDASIKGYMALNNLEKGLRSRALPEQMAAIVNLTAFMRENPFPFFVNNAVLRLCDTFRDENNELRLCIVRAISECRDQLKLVFSVDEAAWRVLKVSHSNDPLARSLTLQMLSQLAPILAENKQIHHLITTSLDSEELQERAAAIMAVKAFVNESSTFSTTILDKLVATLKDPSASSIMKIKLVEVFANMNSDAELTMKIMGLAERLFADEYCQDLLIALISSLTTLSLTCRFAFSNLITLLVERLKTSRENRTLCLVILTNMQRLATAAHVLTTTQVNDLCDFGDSVTDKDVQVQWLITLSQFTAQNLSKVNQIICGKIARRPYLLSQKHVSVRLAALNLLINLFKFSSSVEIASSLQIEFISSLSSLKRRHSEKFYRLITAFIKLPSCPEETVHDLVSAVLSVGSTSRVPHLHLLQFLVAAAESHSELYKSLSEWAASKLQEDVDYSKLTLFACLVYAPVDKLTMLPENHLDCWGKDPWVLYLVARNAMRNGHCRSVALPLLDEILPKAKSFATRSWLSALRDIAQSSVESFTAAKLEKSIELLRSASLSLSTLCTSQESNQYFFFGYRFAECMAAMLTIVRKMLIVFNSVGPLYATVPVHLQQRIAMRFRECFTSIKEVKDKWLNLYRHCFDADSNTLSTVELHAAMCELMAFALMLFVEQQPLNVAHIPASSCCTLFNKRFRASLLWAKGRFESLDALSLTSRFSKENLSLLHEVFGHLCTLPLCIPRFVFQQLKRTHIKLNLLPQSNRGTTVTITTIQKVPITVEGAIESTKNEAISYVVVNASAKFSRDIIKSYAKCQTAPQDGKFFKACFLLAFSQSCTVEFTVNFVDEKTQQVWESEASAEIKIVVHQSKI